MPAYLIFHFVKAQVSPENKAHFDIIHDADENSDIDENLGSAIRELWKDLVARVRTSGIVTEKYVIDGAQFEMYDVGGQRNERKKWIHCFDDVTAIIFVAALSEYDQNLFEDSQTNRMVEAIDLFGEICNNRYFTNSSMILFLNKRDLYLEKIKNVHIGDQPSFSDFDTPFGHEDYYNMGIKYFTSKFKNVNENLERQIYHHATCATDSQNVEVVFNSCKEIILRGSMKDTFG